MARPSLLRHPERRLLRGWLATGVCAGSAVAVPAAERIAARRGDFLGVFQESETSGLRVNYYDVNDAARAFDDYVISDKIDTRLNFPSAASTAAGHETTKKGRTSRQRGVCRVKGGKWRAQIYVDGTLQSLGTFVDEDEAGRAYRKAAHDKAARKQDSRPRKRKRK